MAKLPSAYHCDGFYSNGVCDNRGGVDVGDIRYNKDGEVRRRRELCTSHGLAPNDKLCFHCPEMKRYFRKPRVKSVGGSYTWR